MAARVFRVLSSWIFCLVFLVFLLLKIDDKITWNWFIVLIPMWIYDVITLIYSAVGLAVGSGRFESRTTRTVGKGRHIWNITASILKSLFQALLCTYMEYDAGLKPSFILITLWLLLIGTIVNLSIWIFMENS